MHTMSPDEQMELVPRPLNPEQFPDALVLIQALINDHKDSFGVNALNFDVQKSLDVITKFIESAMEYESELLLILSKVIFPSGLSPQQKADFLAEKVNHAENNR